MAQISKMLESGRTLSFEFFPPKTPGAHLTLGRTIAEQELLNPDLVSVTYGAGGSDRHRTGDVVTWLTAESAFTPMPHLTCRGHTRRDVSELLQSYRDMGVENILALAGDPPAGGVEEAGDYQYAIELLEDIVSIGGFSTAVAAHPEVHPRSPDRPTDRLHLAEKLRLADFAMTQFFFEAEQWIRLVDELDALGVTKPVIPGIMPITNKAQVVRMAQMSGADLPAWLHELLDSTDDPIQIRRIGVDVATKLCADLLEAGTPGLHLYALNRPDAVRDICMNLSLTSQ
jgi:methylenetetrahydrofolate reductase (NADPH)